MRSVMTTAMIVVVALAGAIGCRTMTGQSVGTNIDNQTLTASGKTRLAADRLGNLARVGVDANQGVVYLTGTVESEELRQRAEQVAREAGGAREVVNNIQVEASGTAPAASPGSGPPTQSLRGEVTDIDQGRGHVTVRTEERTLELYVPPSALQQLNNGDRVSVDISIRPLP
jgi:hypothetical protein